MTETPETIIENALIKAMQKYVGEPNTEDLGDIMTDHATQVILATCKEHGLTLQPNFTDHLDSVLDAIMFQGRF